MAAQTFPPGSEAVRSGGVWCCPLIASVCSVGSDDGNEILLMVLT